MENAKTQRAVVLNDFEKGFEYCDSFPVKEVSAGRVKIQVEYGLVVPADIISSKGGYGKKSPTLPCAGGIEGSGVVIEVGEGVSKDLIGKKVSFLSSPDADDFSGSWAEYAVVNSMFVFPFNDDVDMQQVAMSHVNPLTALGLVDSIKSLNGKAVILDAALSSLNKMMLRLCKKEEIKVIALVRKAEQLEDLKKLGNEHNLCTSASDFAEKLKSLSHELEATVAVTSIAGDVVSTYAAAMPDKSTIFVLGVLAGQKVCPISVDDLIFKSITLKGWWLSWFAYEGGEAFTEAVKEVIEAYNTKSDIFYSEVSQVIKLSEVKEGLAKYLANMSKGRLLFAPKGIGDWGLGIGPNPQSPIPN